MSLLTIVEAGEILAEKTGRPVTRDSFRHVLMAGAESRLRVYWRNSEQRFSRLFGFAGEVPGSSKVIRRMQIPSFALGRLEMRRGIGLTLFEPADEDWALLAKLRSVDEDGDLGGFRALDDGEAWISLESLLVFEEELHELGGLKTSTPADEVVGRGLLPSSEQWSVRKPDRFRAYNLPLYRSLYAAHQAGRPVPTARELLLEWSATPPAELFQVTSEGVKYYSPHGNLMVADVKAITGAIKRLVKRA